MFAYLCWVIMPPSFWILFFCLISSHCHPHLCHLRSQCLLLFFSASFMKHHNQSTAHTHARNIHKKGFLFKFNPKNSVFFIENGERRADRQKNLIKTTIYAMHAVHWIGCVCFFSPFVVVVVRLSRP